MSAWIEWKGGECPVDPETKVRVELRDGTRDTGLAREFLWNHVDGRTAASRLDIIAYREMRNAASALGPLLDEATTPTEGE
jgi:hypothetical protein